VGYGWLAVSVRLKWIGSFHCISLGRNVLEILEYLGGKLLQ